MIGGCQVKHRTKVATLATFGLAIGGVVAGTSATTVAQFSATAKGADSHAGAATVALGTGNGSVALGYADLKPGDWRVVQLTVSYQGSVPADVSLGFAPAGSPALCVQREGRWTSRPGGAVTVAVGSAAPVSYCDLLNGRTLPLASAVSPGSVRKIDVAVMLSKDAKGELRGLAEKDVATVRASGGFTDKAVGTISIATAARDKVKTGGQREDGRRTVEGAAEQPDAKSAVPPENSPQSHNLTSGASPARPPVTLPAECEQAGMRLDGFEDVIVLGHDQHTWNAVEQRGQGAGPFLVVGTDGDDEIVGSAGADCIVGGGGRDNLSGGAGNDVLIGGDEVDQIDGGAGDDWLFGGPGADDLRGGGGIDRFDGGPDGAFCDAGHDTAGAVRCQAPTAPATAASAGKERSAGEAPSPSTASAPTTASPHPTPSAPTTASASPTASATVAPPSAPPTIPTAQTGAPADGTASAPSGAGEGQSAAPTQAAAPPSSPTTA